MNTLTRLFFACFFGWSTVALGACGEAFESGETTSATCPGDANVTCDEDPWQCAAGQTCWFNQTGDGVQCLNSGPRTEGDECQPMAGSPSCGDLMLCVGNAMGVGQCRRYCASATPCKACPAGFDCRGISFRNQATDEIIANTNVCLPPGF